MRTIQVTGKGRLTVKPDRTRVVLTLEDKLPEYAAAVRRSAEETESLRKLLAGFGFESSELKTMYFSVDAQYESYERYGAHKRRLVGYKFCHRMKIEFDSDNDRLGKMLFALANSPEEPEIELSYTVKDPEAAKNELLGRAVADAKEKASVLTKAAGVVLGEIQSVNYSWGEIDFEVQPLRALNTERCFAADACMDVGIEPDDVEVDDTVTVVWEIG